MPPRAVAGPAGQTASKVYKKERIIQALSRMNDRDTQKAAAEDLLSIVLNMDQEGLSIILSCLCTTGSEHKVFARKECARAIGVIASGACPLREQALQQPHLGKMLGQLRKSLQDPDSGVREASSEALALVAQGLTHVDPGGGAQGSLANPVVKLIFDCLAEQRKELNAAACTALGMAAPYLGALDAALARELVRKLNSASFQAPAALLAALAHSDPATGEPVGLLKSVAAAFVPILPALVGQPSPPSLGGSAAGSGGSGVAGALSRPDWPVRLAAADMLRCTAMLLGPLMEHEGCWTRGDARSLTGRAIRALESCKFDKLRDVRDVARNALAVLEELHAYGSGGGTLQGWPEHIARRLFKADPHPPVATSTFVIPSLVAEAAPAPAPGPHPLAAAGPRRNAVSPGRRPRTAQPPVRASASSPPPPAAAAAAAAARSPMPPERRSPPLLARGGSVAERFRAAHRNGDLVSVHYLGGVQSEPALPLGPGSEGLDSEAVQPQPQTSYPSTESADASVSGRAHVGDDTLPDAAQGGRCGMYRLASKVSDSGRPIEQRLPGEPVYSVYSRVVSQLAGDGDGYGEGDVAAADAMLQSLTLHDHGQDEDKDNEDAAVLDLDAPPTFSPPRIEEAAGRNAPPSVAELLDWAAAAAAHQLLQPVDHLTTAVPSTTSGLKSSAPAPLPPPPSTAPADTDAAEPAVRVPVEEWLASQQRLRSLEEQQRQLLEAFSSMSEQNRHTIEGLQAKVRSLEAALEAAQSQGAEQQQEPEQQQQQQGDDDGAPPAEVEVSWALRTIRPGSPLVQPSRAGTTAHPAGGGGGGGGSSNAVAGSACGGAAADVCQAYREVLAAGRLSDMQLLRLMQRTGPIWGELGPQLSAQLLAAFTASLQQARGDGPLLSRMMPWLWRLADEEHAVFEAPADMRAPLLAALRTAQAAVTEPLLYDRLVLLVNTLRTHWALPDSQATAGNQRGNQQQAPPLPPAPQQQQQLLLASPAVHPPPSAGGVGGGGGTLQELSFGVGEFRAAEAAPPHGVPVAAVGGYGGAVYGNGRAAAVAAGAVPAALEAQSPAVECPGGTTVTPRMATVRSSRAVKSPSIGTLMGQWSELQRDFAAMSSPASQRPQSRGPS